MDRITTDTAAFRSHWGLPQPVAPILDLEIARRYISFFQEEFVDEMGQALDSFNQEKALELICDSLADGMVYAGHLAGELGVLDLMPLVWQEIVFSNSTKGGEDGLADSKGRWIKGPNYERPVLAPLFAKEITIQLHCHFSQDDLDKVLMCLPPWLECWSWESEWKGGGCKVLEARGEFPPLPALIAALRSVGVRVTYQGDSAVTGKHLIAFSNLSAKSYQDWVKRVALYKGGLTYTTTGLSAESGEALSIINKTMRRLQTGAVNASDLLPEARNKLIDELGDVYFSLAATLNELGINFGDLARLNIEKVEKRMADGTVFSGM